MIFNIVMVLLSSGGSNATVWINPCGEGGQTVKVVLGSGKGGTVVAYSDDFVRSWDQTHLYRALQWLNANLGYTFTYYWSNCSGQYAISLHWLLG
ncbi:MAG: hypothetical protein ABIM88_02575 [candidate division WOR-3 bacterium]